MADLSGVHPLENASKNPATQQLLDLFKKYAPDAHVTLPGVRGFAAWLLFAKAAQSCGDDLTRRCVYEAARTETAWTGGGLLAPVDLTEAGIPLDCLNVEEATSKGWEPADFKPDNGAYRCYCVVPFWRRPGADGLNFGAPSAKRGTDSRSVRPRSHGVRLLM